MSGTKSSFLVCKISTKIKTATIADTISMNSVIILSRTPSSHIKIRSFKPNYFRSFLTLWCKLQQPSEGNSQRGYQVFTCGKNRKWTLTAWKSSKLKTVCCSTLVAETLALPDVYNTVFLIQSLEKEKTYAVRTHHVNS